MGKKSGGLSAVHLTMMALGTVIGGSFFLGSSVAINAAGPSVIIAFILGGVLIYFILFALSEMTVANPDTGSFRTFAAQAFGQGAGFTVGWVYWTGMILAMSSEATAVSILLRQWYPGVSIPFLGSLIIISVTLLNLLGADKLSKLESGLAAIKLLAIVSFIIIALLLISGLISGKPPAGIGELSREPLLPGGVKGIAGSMLVVIFSYAGFEVIGLAASEAEDPRKTVPKAIAYTVVSLVALFIISVALLLPLIPTAEINESTSPMVAVLNRWGMGWAGTVINLVLITAILSTMLAAMFGLGRMIRSLVDAGLAPKWLKDKGDVPERGILFSGFSMLLGLGLGLLLPRVYLFLISSGGYALLFTYTAIIATHIRFRRSHGCPPEGRCQMPWYPYSSWIVLISLVIVIFSMPFIPGQSSGLIAGLIMTASFLLIYLVVFKVIKTQRIGLFRGELNSKRLRSGFSAEFSEELDKPEKPGQSEELGQKNKNEE